MQRSTQVILVLVLIIGIGGAIYVHQRGIISQQKQDLELATNIALNRGESIALLTDTALTQQAQYLSLLEILMRVIKATDSEYDLSAIDSMKLQLQETRNLETALQTALSRENLKLEQP